MQGLTEVGLRLRVRETQGLFSYYSLLIIILLSMQTAIDLTFAHPYIY